MWKKSEYTKKEINNAGKQIINSNLTAEEKKRYIAIIDNWRAAHAFPMNTFAIHLKHLVGNIPDAVVAQRIKRLVTIINKLERYPDMNLYRMQDLGGCRVIVPSIKDVYSVVLTLRNSRIRHEEHNYKDYIAIPKSDGYRGYHLIYKYKSDRREDYNGLRVEVQIRTKLQHLWATAVETVGLFTDNGLKFNQGSKNWLQFFKLASALFAIEEKSALPEGVDSNPNKIISELLALSDALDAIETMWAIGLATQNVERKTKKNFSGYYLLILDINKQSIQVKRYAGIEKGLDLATQDYYEIEKQKGNRNIDVVLVSALSFDALTIAYPNYFADIRQFLNTLINIMKKYNGI